MIDTPSTLKDAVINFVSDGTSTVISLESDITLTASLNLFVIDESDQIQPVGRSLTIEGNVHKVSGDGDTSGFGVFLSEPSGSTTLTVRDLGLSGFSGSGALVVVSGATIIERSLFTNNTFTSNGSIPGTDEASAGAINAFGHLTVTESQFTGNKGSMGGAIFSAPTLTSQFVQTGSQETPLQITGSTFAFNEAAESGGAIYSLQSLTMVNSTLSENSAKLVGAINVAGSVTLNFCTIVENVGDSTRGAVASTGDVQITHSVVYGNDSRDGIKDVSIDGTLTISSSLVTSTDSITSTLYTTDLDGSNIVDEDPLLSELGDHGGFTLPGETVILTRSPQTKSPIIDAIDLEVVEQAAISTDQRGPGFPRFVNDRADMGAVEFDGVIIPDPSKSPTDPLPDSTDKPSWGYFTWPTSLPDTI